MNIIADSRVKIALQQYAVDARGKINYIQIKDFILGIETKLQERSKVIVSNLKRQLYNKIAQSRAMIDQEIIN